MIWYRGRLKLFGDAFADQRLTEGIRTVCRIVGIRILKNNMKAIKNIMKQVLYSHNYPLTLLRKLKKIPKLMVEADPQQPLPAISSSLQTKPLMSCPTATLKNSDLPYLIHAHTLSSISKADWDIFWYSNITNLL